MCSKIEIEFPKGFSVPLQIDGEPFELDGPANITINLSTKVNVLVRPLDGKTPVETKILKVLDWAEEKHHISSEQRGILLDQFLRTIVE